MKKRLLAIVLLAFMILTFTSCEFIENLINPQEPPTVHTLTLDTKGGSVIEPLSVEDGKTAEKPADPTKEGYTFGGWYADEACTTEWSFDTPITADTTIYAKWTEETITPPVPPEVEYEDVHYEFNVSDATAGTLSEDDIHGKFTVKSGTEIRNRTKSYEGVEYNKSVKIGNAAATIVVDVPGTGTLSFIIQNGSSGAARQFIKVTAPDGTVHDIEFAGTDEGSPLVKIDVEVTEGQWTISRGKNGGTQDIYFLSLDCSVPVSEENGFELVNAGKVDYLLGEELDTSRLQLNATFANGKTDTLDLANVTVDSSAFNKDAAGTYTITVSYKNYTALTYQVNVYAPESIQLDFDAVEKLTSGTSAGNGVYYNFSFREVYALGEELSTEGLSVTMVAKCGDKEKRFLLGEGEYTITGFDSTSAGDKTLTISALGVNATAVVHVVDTAPAKDGDTFQVKVDKTYTGVIGANVDGYNMFTTIEQALNYLSREDIGDADKKLLLIGEGLFTEKLEITIPNLTIRGAGPDKTMIEWDSLYGLVDAGGFTHTTDSTQTVAVRESATNVRIEGLTISNYWNSQDRMDTASLGIERGLALLVQSDRFVMTDSALLGIQDTLELFTGRQYFENVFIAGYTDFVFGTNNTTYFKNCIIHVIDTSKDDAGTAGYLTAFKGSNKGEGDAIVYGAIFDGCRFTADEGVMEGKTAIGRTWGAYAAVAVINSELGAHISLDGYDKAENKNKRYISMNGIHPTDETVQFVEYNNTGAGAITEAVAGMRMLTAEEAANYSDFTKIFGTTNGKVSYLDPWDPSSTEVAVDDRTYYYFNGGSSPTGTSYTYDQNLNGTTGTFGDIAIDATAGKVTARTSDTQINTGAKLVFSVKAGTLVTVKTHSGYGNYTLNRVGTSASETFSIYYAEDTEVTFLAIGQVYLHWIAIDPDAEAPEAPTLTEIKVDGMVTEYLVGEELSLDGVSVNAHFSDSSVRPVEYTVDTSAVNTAEAGTYDVVFTCEGTTVTVPVTFVADFTISESTTIDLSATGANIQGTTGKYQALTVDATNGKFADNGSGWVQVNAGTIISFELEGDAEVSVTAYGGADNFDIVIADGVCTITATANDYLKAISIKIIRTIESTTTIDLSKTGASIQGTTGEYNGLYVDATSGKFADNNGGWVQVNAGTIITLYVLEGAEVSVTPYSSADNFDIVVANGVCTIEVLANDYLKAVTVKYTKVYSESTTIDLSATGANIQGTTGNYDGLSVDATNGKFADNNGGWVQVNTGTVITLNVAEGAAVSVTAYTSADNFDIVIADGVCTITATGNDYLKAITVKYAVVYSETTTIDLSATGANIQKATGTYEGLSVDATNGKFADNNGGWVQVNTGTVITLNVAEGAAVSVTAYSSADNFTIVVEGGLCTITATGNDYLSAITVTYE